MHSKRRHSFYLVPHPDDWLFFCSPQVAKDLKNKSRIVFIYVTAGDAGQENNWWIAREKGALAATNTHRITSYFLRLPDGMERGTGTSRYGHSSLMRLQRENHPLRSVDGSATYTSWGQFCAKIETIIQEESRNVDPDRIWIHAPEYDAAKNFGDHADHVAMANAAQTIARGRYHTSWWISYWSYYCPPNLSLSEIGDKRARFLTYSREVERLTGEPPNEHEWECWGKQGHFREVLKDGTECKSYDARCPTIHQFSAAQNAEYYRRIWGDIEEKGFRITNRLNGRSALLSPIGKIIWQKLKEPTSYTEVLSLLKDADDFMQALLKMKLIYKIAAEESL